MHAGEILEFENTNIFELENKGVNFSNFIDFSMCKNYICKDEISNKIAIDPYKIFYILTIFPNKHLILHFKNVSS